MWGATLIGIGGAVRLAVAWSARPIDSAGRFADVATWWGLLNDAVPVTYGGGGWLHPSPYDALVTGLWALGRGVEPQYVLRALAVALGALSLGVAAVSFRLAGQLLRRDRGVPLAAAAFAVFAPFLAFPELLEHTAAILGMVVYAAAFWLLVSAVERQGIGARVGLGVALGCGLLVQRAGVGCFIGSAVVLVVARHREGRLAAGVAHAAAVCACAAAVVGAYALLIRALLGWPVTLAVYSADSSMARWAAVGALVPAWILAVGVARLWRMRRSSGADARLASALVVGGATVLIAAGDAVVGFPVGGSLWSYLMTALVPVSLLGACGWATVTGWGRAWARAVLLGLVLAAIVVALPAVLSHVVERQPYPEADNALAVVTDAAGFRDAARAMFERLAAEHDLPQAHENLATMELQAGRPRAALRRLQRALHALAEPRRLRQGTVRALRAEYYNSMAVVAEHVGWRRVALAAARRASALDPTSPEPPYNVGVLLLETGQPAAAQKYFATHSAQLGDFAEARLLRAVAAQRASDCISAETFLMSMHRPAEPAKRHAYVWMTAQFADAAITRRRWIRDLPIYVHAGYSAAVCSATIAGARTAAAALRRGLVTGDLPAGILADSSWRSVVRGRLVPMVLPNIIVVMIDTLRADHVGAYGYPRPTTPNLDRLAEVGVRFEHAFSVSSWTGPAVASLFTGVLPSRHGFVESTSVMRDDLPTLAEQLTRLGYRTAAFSANFVHVTERTGLNRGFGEFRTLLKVTSGEDYDAIVKDIPLRGYDAHELTEQVRQWLATTPPSQPFFLYVHYIDPHAPYEPPASSYAAFASTAGDTRGASIKELTPLEHEGRPLDAAALQRLVNLYDGEIRFVDTEVGRLLDEVDGKRYCDNCVVVVTADHGEEFKDHQHLFHGYTLYDEMMRIPLLMYGRGTWNVAPAVAPDLVQLTDVFATLVEIAGGVLEAGLDGQSLVPLLAGRGGHAREFVRGELHSDELIDRLMHPKRHTLAVRDQHTKLLVAPDGGTELYRVDVDPAEHNNLSASQPEEVSRLLGAQTAVRAHPEVVPTRSLTDAERERMRALGYLQ